MKETAGNKADVVKEAVTMARAAEYYGFTPNRAGFIRCPFHADDKPSLKLYPGARGWYCFGCSTGGSVIDFVMRLFGLSFLDALDRLDSDFQLGLGRMPKPEPAAAAERRRAKEQEQEELARFRADYDRHASRYRVLWRAWKAGIDDPLYPDACQELLRLEDWFDAHPWR